MRKRINSLKNRINKVIREYSEHEADKLIDKINNSNDSRVMFDSAKLLNANARMNKVIVHDENDDTIESDACKADIVKTWFKEQMNRGKHDELEPFHGNARPLNVPITVKKVREADRSLNNNHAVGRDGIPNQLLKYAGKMFQAAYGKIINNCFETNSYLKCVGKGTLNPLQKPGKPKGPTKSLRPLILSNPARKILSLIVLRRIENQILQYTGPRQCAYKQKRSCSDIIWCQKMMISVVMRTK